MEKFERKIHCEICGLETNHGILSKHEQLGSCDGNYFTYQYLIVQCLGCDDIHFVSIYEDEQNWEYDEHCRKQFIKVYSVHFKDGFSVRYEPPSEEEHPPLKGFT